MPVLMNEIKMSVTVGKRYFFAFLVIMLPVTSCRMLKIGKFTVNTPDSTLYRDLETNDTSNISYLSWRKLFTDPHLQDLISTTIENNPDLQVAEARVHKAEAAFRQSRAEFLPSLDVGVNANYQSKNPLGFGVPESYQVFGSTSWEADIWGRLRSAKRASLATLLASEAYRKAVITDIVSSVAMNYYLLLSYDSQLEITKMTLEKRIQNAETMQVMKENDVITGADLVLSEANRYSAEVLIPDLEQRIFETENVLSLLMGKAPGPIERGTLDEQDLSAELAAGIPAQLLRNRPDVLEAEYRLRSFYENIKSARADFYPALSLTARGGFTERTLSALFGSPFLFWNVTGSILQPVLNYGLNRQHLRSAKADYEESKASFRSILLNAGSEVVNSMKSYETATRKIELRQTQIGYLEKAVEYTNELLKYSSNTSYIDVLTSEVNLLNAQLSGVSDKLQQLQAVVQLYKSLGGGWR
jgi:NodT family efflux transporter outer membrane factor (OMF) lipoprotein